MVGAIIGIASSLGGAAMSFTQANKQKKLQGQAEAEAAKALAEARKRLDVNYMDALSVQKEPYELQREAMISQGAQALEAGKEGEDRGAAVVAGKIYGLQKEAQGGIRTAMGKELTDIERLKVAEESRLRDLQTQLDLDVAAGAALAERNAAEMAAQSTAQGFEGLTSAATQVANLVPLFPKSDTVNNGNPITSPWDPNAMSPISGQNSNIDYMSPASGFGFGTLPTVSATNALNQSFGTQGNLNFYNPFRLYSK
jgi:hypothetical protein